MGKVITTDQVKQKYTKIAVVLDSSSSMESIRSSTINGFNEFLETQKAIDEKCDFTLTKFASSCNEVYNNKPINDVDSLTKDTFVPNGMTALLDAIGNTVTTLKDGISKLKEDEKPDRVIVLIITDGGENYSTGFTGAQIKEMVEYQESVEKWDFIFLAANQNAIDVGKLYGIQPGKAMSFGFSGAGSAAAFTSVSENLTQYRSSDDLSTRGTNFEYFGSNARSIQKGLGAQEK